jgi:hypothetical protein
MPKTIPIEVGAYYFPNYHRDPRNERVHGPGWTEWELLKQAQPRFPGHPQPKIPLWGYEDEANPRVMARKIAAAADHGLNHFLFDWYWYEDGPFLGRCLDEGFLQAPNRDRLKFALMWANHDWLNIMPAKKGGPHSLQYPGAISRAGFDAATDHIVANYFSQPNSWKIDGSPYFSFYELMTLVRGLGGIDETRAALESFRAKTRAAGLPGLHLNAVVWGVQILPNEVKLKNPNEMLQALGFDSVTSYVWIHHVSPAQFPATPYDDIAAASVKVWTRLSSEFSLPYFPNVTMGWDPSPRTVQSEEFSNAGYPWMATLEGNTPQRFEVALREAKTFLDRRSPALPRILTINAWNEWTEGSYLEPDTVHGLGYLQAIQNVFGAARPSA